MLAKQIVEVQFGVPFVVQNPKVHPNVTVLIQGEGLTVHAVPSFAGAVGNGTHSSKKSFGSLVVEVNGNRVASLLVPYVETLKEQK